MFVLRFNPNFILYFACHGDYCQQKSENLISPIFNFPERVPRGCFGVGLHDVRYDVSKVRAWSWMRTPHQQELARSFTAYLGMPFRGGMTILLDTRWPLPVTKYGISVPNYSGRVPRGTVVLYRLLIKEHGRYCNTYLATKESARTTWWFYVKKTRISE